MPTLRSLLAQAEFEAEGDLDVDLAGVCALDPGLPGHLAWCGGEAWLAAARASQAAVILVPPALRDALPQAVVVAHPQAAFAEVARLFAPDERPAPGIDPSAQVHAEAQLGEGVRVGPLAVIGAGCRLGPGVSVGAGAILGTAVEVGADSDIGARVVIGDRCVVGARALLLPGAVIGSRGFGNYHDGRRWRDIPQLGRVILGDDVEVGANTTIDRGALGDTVIADNVRIDNLCQIAHNVQIGAHTALAAQVGVAGSTVIGAGCMLGGQVGVNGHIQIADRVIISGGSNVLQPVTEAGTYGSGTPLLPVAAFRRMMALLRRLEPRLKILEKAVRREH